MQIRKSYHVGPHGASFERVGRAFENYGYAPPSPDGPEGTGAFVSNIISQYVPHLSEQSVLAIIEYGLTSSRQSLLKEKEHPDWKSYTLEQLTDNYVERYILPE